MLSVGPEEKEAFRDNKNVSFVKCEKGYFPKGLTHGFSQENGNFC